ncbi:hypothetical protein HYW18_02395 [Candidatus Uhrbacteria bacterium]|nr:hypothetical protein [Candidatus Uhrbacteria bacterium]
MRRDIFTSGECRLLQSLSTPAKVQDYVNALPFNFERQADTCRSPRGVMRHKEAHCLEGAMFAALALRFHGHRPLLLDLEASGKDDDHVVALFQQHGCWGAISKTNHAVLRYREPVYRTLRELALSYFHEYFLQKGGRKTLRTFSRPVSLTRFDRKNWMTSEGDVWFVRDHLYTIPHTPLLSRSQIETLRPADRIERCAGEVTEW